MTYLPYLPHAPLRILGSPGVGARRSLVRHWGLVSLFTFDDQQCTSRQVASSAMPAHQLRESHSGLAALAATVGFVHLLAAAAALLTVPDTRRRLAGT
jgi:hypothetical protein